MARVWLMLAVCSCAHAQPLADFDRATDVPSLTPWSDQDIPHTMAYARRPATPVVDGEWLAMPVTVWHTGLPDWNSVRIRAALDLAHFALSACKIRLVGPAPEVTTEAIIKHDTGSLRRRRGAWETLLLLRPERSLGGRVIGVASGSVIHVTHTLIYTTAAHELGHRLGLRHRASPYNLMTTGPILFSTPESALAAGAAYFEPARFRFEPSACLRMRRTLRHGLARAGPRR